jgi:hypothetical protein
VLPLAQGEREPQTHTGKDRTTSALGAWCLSPRVGPSNLHEHQDGGGWKGDTLKFYGFRIAGLLNKFLEAFQIARVFGAMDHSMTVCTQDSEIQRDVIFHGHTFFQSAYWL